VKNSYNWSRIEVPEILPRSNGVTEFNTCLGGIYLAIRNLDSGAQMLRSHDGFKWQSITESGFGNRNNGDIYGPVEFKDWIYCGTFNGVYQGHGMAEPVNGAQILRSQNGSDWEYVVKDGFGNRYNMDMWTFCDFKDHLYVGTWNPKSGGEIWRSGNGISFTKVLGPHLCGQDYIRSFATASNNIYASTGNGSLAVYSSRDGLIWQDISAGKLPDYLNCGTTMATVGETLIVGCTKWGTATAEIWRYHHEHWEIITSFSPQSSSSTMVNSMIPYGDRGVIITVWDRLTGVKIFLCDDILDPTLHQINADGFGNNHNSGGKTVIVGDNLLVALNNAFDRKSEIWWGKKSISG